MKDPIAELLDVIIEQNETVSACIELLAIGHKLAPETARQARAHQSRSNAKLIRLKASRAQVWETMPQTTATILPDSPSGPEVR